MESCRQEDVFTTAAVWRRIVPRGADGVTVATVHGFPRQALHAAKLRFQHPRSAETVSFSAALPDDIVRLARVLADDAD